MRIFKRVLKIIFITLLTAVVGFSIVVIVMKIDKLVVSEISIDTDVSEDESIISKEYILRDLEKSVGDLIGKPHSEVDYDLLERRIRKNRSVLDAEVHYSLTGSFDTPTVVINIDIEERVAVIRAYVDGTDFYIDKDGNIFPWSSNYTPYLPIAKGYVRGERAIKDLAILGSFIKGSDYWMAMIDVVNIREDGKIILYLTVDGPSVILGDTSRLEEKFRSLRAMCEQALPKVGWDHYKTISVEYKGQVVAK